MGKVVSVVSGLLSTVASIAAVIPGPHQPFAAAAAVGFGLVSQLSQPKASVPESAVQLGRLQARLDTQAPRKMVLGYTAMPADIHYYEGSGTDDEFIDYILTVAAHEIGSIDSIYFEDELAWQNGVHQGDYLTYLTNVNVVTEGNASNTILINGGSRWGSDDRLTGCAYVRIRIRRTGVNDEEQSPLASGLPGRATIVGRGMPMYDPRLDSTRGGSGSHRADDQSTWGPSSGNPIIQALNVLLGWRINGKLSVGAGLPTKFINFESAITAANICDETIALSGGGSQPRYRTAGAFSTDDAPMAIIAALLAGCAGDLLDSGGELSFLIKTNTLATPEVVFGDDDIVGPASWNAMGNEESLENIISGTFTDPSADSLYQPVPYPSVSLASEDGIERTLPVNFATVENAPQAERLAKQTLQRKQYPGTFSAEYNMKGLAATVGSIVWQSYSPRGWLNKPFRVVRQKPSRSGRIELVLREEDVSIYAWSAEDSAPVTVATPKPFDPRNAPSILLARQAAQAAAQAAAQIALGTMNTGGIGDITFEPNESLSFGSPNDGEIRIEGTTFFPPKGGRHQINQSQVDIFTAYEGSRVGDPFFLVFSKADVLTRFPGWSSISGMNRNFFSAEYDVVAEQWTARDNSFQGFPFDPVDTDVIVAVCYKRNPSGGIEQVNSLLGASKSLPGIGIIQQPSLLPNSDFKIIDEDGFPAGIYPIESTTSRDQGTSIATGLRITGGPDNNVAYGFPAIPIDDRKIYTVRIRHLPSVTSNAGLFLRLNERSSSLADGKTHIGSGSGAANNDVRTSFKDLVGSTPISSGSFVEDTFTYTPTSGTKFASFSMYNWTGFSGNYDIAWVAMSDQGNHEYEATRNTGALNADGLDSIALTDFKITGELPPAKADANLRNANQQWSQVGGSGKPVDNATRNTGAANADGLNNIDLGGPLVSGLLAEARADLSLRNSQNFIDGNGFYRINGLSSGFRVDNRKITEDDAFASNLLRKTGGGGNYSGPLNPTRNTGALNADGLDFLPLSDVTKTSGELPVVRASASLRNANQQFSDVSGPGTPQDDADVSKAIVGANTVNLDFDSSGTIKSGQLGAKAVLRLATSTNVTLGSGVAWSLSVVSGSYAGASPTISGSGSGQLNFSSAPTTPGVINVTATNQGRTYTHTIQVTTTQDPPPTGGSSGGGGGGSTNTTGNASTTGITSAWSTVYQGTVFTAAGSNSVALLAANHNLFPSTSSGATGSGSVNVQYQWQRETAVGSNSWVDVGGATNSNPDPSFVVESGFPTPSPGSISNSRTDTGRSASTEYSYRLRARLSTTHPQINSATYAGNTSIGLDGS